MPSDFIAGPAPAPAATAADIVCLIAGLIDESGSMTDVRDDTIGGYNTFVETIQKEQAGRKAFVSTFLFDHSHGNPILRTIQDGGDLAGAVKLTRDNYAPRGSTPLYDAIGQAVTKTRDTAAKSGANKVTFLILTDGHENSSHEFTHAKVKALIDQCSADGWQVIFLGADLTDAHGIGVGYGTSSANAMSFDKSNTKATFSATVSASAAYRSGANASADLQMSDDVKARLAAKAKPVKPKSPTSAA
jgi:hypothetical protein